MTRLINRYVRFFFVLSVIPLSIYVFTCCSTPQKAVVETPKTTSETQPKMPLKLTGDSFRIGFYNVENLFDINDDPVKIDSEYLPTSRIQWTIERYEKKLQNIAKVVDALNPTILGMTEVENDLVLQDLVNQSLIKSKNYGFVHFESPDERGIDVALIYKKADFTVKNKEFHRINFPNSNDKTRDILQVDGVILGQNISVFVNHFPSRRGGAEASEDKRIFVAQMLKKAVDAAMKKDKNTHVIIMGDLNDDPSDKSLTEGLEAKQWDRNTSNELIVNGLYNLASGVKRDGLGSYYYQKNWEVIDQIIVSGNLLAENSTLVTQDQESIFKEDFITYLEKKSGLRLPNRTYTGPIYRGGFSDHFPVYVSVFLKK